MKMKSLALLVTLAAAPAFAAPLQLDVYNPQEQEFFRSRRRWSPVRMKRFCLMRSSAPKMARSWWN